MSDTFSPYPGGIKYPRRPEKLVICTTRSGKTLITNKPIPELKRETGFPKSMQEAVRRAVTYAEYAWDQPVYEYRAVGTPLSAYNLAVADYLGRPQVLDIDVRGWTGGIGQEIRIRAKDNFMVLSVRLAICGTEFLWEEGEATQSESDNLLWIYTTTTPVTREPGLRLEAFAYDLPGNVGELHIQLR